MPRLRQLAHGAADTDGITARGVPAELKVLVARLARVTQLNIATTLHNRRMSGCCSTRLRLNGSTRPPAAGITSPPPGAARDMVGIAILRPRPWGGDHMTRRHARMRGIRTPRISESGCPELNVWYADNHHGELPARYDISCGVRRACVG